MNNLVTLAQTYRTLSCDKEIGRHYERCEVDHAWCLVVKLADEVERLTVELEKARAEVKRLTDEERDEWPLPPWCD